MLNATIVKKIEVTPELLILRIKPDAGVPAFEAGQYVAVGLTGAAPRPANFPPETEPHAPDKLIKRAYSIGSPPSEKEYLEFYIAVVPTGALTSRIVLLKEGDRVYLAPKITGTFTVHDVPEDHNLYLVSTGTGIAPYIAMLKTPSLWKPNRKIVLIHGVRYVKDLAYRDELVELSKREPRFAYYPTVSRADDSWAGERGYVQKFFTEGKLKLDPKLDHVFMCGNPAMIEDTQKYLEANGYSVHSKRQPGNLHLEKYW